MSPVSYNVTKFVTKPRFCDQMNCTQLQFHYKTMFCDQMNCTQLQFYCSFPAQSCQRGNFALFSIVFVRSLLFPFSLPSWNAYAVCRFFGSCELTLRKFRCDREPVVRWNVDRAFRSTSGEMSITDCHDVICDKHTYAYNCSYLFISC